MGVSYFSLRPDHTAQGSSTRKINPPYFWLKNQWGLEWWKKLPDFPCLKGLQGAAEELLDFSCLKGPHRLSTYTNPPALGFIIRGAAGRVSVT